MATNDSYMYGSGVDEALPRVNASLVTRVKTRYDDMKTRKAAFTSVYDILARYILGRRNFSQSSNNINPEDYFDPEIFDDTAPRANALMSSCHVGALWPNGAKSFRIALPLELRASLSDDEEVKDYYEFVSQKLADGMDNPKCGYPTALDEYMLELGALGTSAVFVEDNDGDYDVPVFYRSVSIRDLFIDVGPNGSIDTVYLRRWMTVLDIYKEYGKAPLTDGELKGIKDGCADKTKREIVIAIEPRLEITGESYGSKDFPYSSCHVDVSNGKILRESGYKQLPIFVGRFSHMLNELYGRCPGMIALPSIRMINEMQFDIILAVEQQLKPPMGMIEGSVLGDEVDLSPGTMVIISPNGKMGNYTGKPLEALITVGDMTPAAAKVTELTELINNHFYLDRLMDLNNDQRMTLGETNIRNDLRGQSLNTFYTRQEKELFEPVIERSFDVYLEKGLLGLAKGDPRAAELEAQGVEVRYIPDKLVQRMIDGKELYRVEFISPAARIKQNEEAQGTLEVFTFVRDTAAISPDVLDIIDFDAGITRLAQLKGASSTLIRSQEAIDKIRSDRAQQQQAAMQAQQAKDAAGALNQAASANKTAAETPQ